MVYTAGVVLIEGTEAPSTVLPVQERNIFVMPSLDGATQPPISPDELPGLQLWLKSDAGITYDSDGVSRWADQSGTTENHAVQDEPAFRPAFVAHGLGSKPVLRFDGTDDYLAIENLSYPAGTAIADITVCALVRSDFDDLQIIASFDRDEYWRLALKDDAATNLNIGWDTSDSAGGTDDLRSPASYTDGNWHLVCGWFSAAASPADKQIFLDGEQVASAPNAHLGNALGSGGATRFGFIGVGSAADVFNGTRSPLFFLRGDIAEILIYHHALSDDERRQLERYFVDRYRS